MKASTPLAISIRESYNLLKTVLRVNNGAENKEALRKLQRFDSIVEEWEILKRENSSLKTENEVLIDKCDKLNEFGSSFAQLQHAYTNQLGTYQIDIVKLQEEGDRLKIQNEEQKAKAEELEAAKEALQTKLDESLSLHERDRAQFAASSHQFRQKEQKFLAKLTQLEKARQKDKALTEQVAELKKQLLTSQDKLPCLEDLELRNEELITEVETLRRRWKRYEQELELRKDEESLM